MNERRAMREAKMTTTKWLGGYHMTEADANFLALAEPEYVVRKYFNRHDGGEDTRNGRTFGVWDGRSDHWVYFEPRLDN